MQKQVQYKQIVGTKQACVVLELSTITSGECVAEAVHYLQTRSAQAISGPSAHQAMYLAMGVLALQQSMLLLRIKHDYPYAVQYAVVDGKFIIAVSFSPHGSYIRNVCKLLVDKFFVKSLSGLRSKLKRACPEVQSQYSFE